MLWLTFICFVFVDALRPNQKFLVKFGRFPVFLGWTITKQRIRCLAHGHTTVTLVSLELAALRSPVSSSWATALLTPICKYGIMCGTPPFCSLNENSRATLWVPWKHWLNAGVCVLYYQLSNWTKPSDMQFLCPCELWMLWYDGVFYPLLSGKVLYIRSWSP